MSSLHKLSRIMMRNYSAIPVSLGGESIEPGMLLDWDDGSWLGITRPAKITGIAGKAWDYDLEDDVNDANYPREHGEANILVESVTDHFSIGGSIPLPQYGLSLAGEFESNKEVTLSIGTVTMSAFNNGFAGQRILKALRKTKGTENWEWINDRLLVTEAYFTGEMTFHFKRGIDASLKAKIEQINEAVDTKLITTTDSRINMVGSSSVPFAVRGLTV